jgi:hypothetical protein
MNTLEQLSDDIANWMCEYGPDGHCDGHETIAKLVYEKYIEHTHTQTIQSVRERVEARMIDQSPRDKHDTKCGHCGGFPTICGCKEYNQALADLLKDLEAPVEGDNVN